MLSGPSKTLIKRLALVIIFTGAFAYIEAAVVVYLRTIFHPDGFTFPLAVFSGNPLQERLLVTEIFREAATLAIIITGCLVFAQGRAQRAAFFLIIFAVWDILYYVWLKVLLDWPASVMDWDILFLIPMVWASPTLAPLIVSATMLIFAAFILYRDSVHVPLTAGPFAWLGFVLAGLIIVTSFCLAGRGITQPDYADYFSWPLFAAGLILAIGVFLSCLRRPQKR